ncbi:MAG TPA: galactose-1-phosphate uridylyltransferase [Limnochordia bacterium]|nr:galactose-1-phosphate uridylyltransferase [Limnochordia bacterium]
MSEMRWHPLLRQWVVTATHRQERTYKPPKEYCPFCPTQPGAFPTEVPASEYEIVVFENRFPSFRREPPEPDVEGSELYPVRPAQGVCEVVLYSQDHDATLREMPVQHIDRLVQVWTDRYIELGSRPEIEYVFIFENKGDAVGVTLHHPHGQIYAFPYIPPIPQAELDAGREHREKTGRCLMCDIVAEERQGPRVIWESAHFSAYVPFFARYPFEVHIAAKEHLPSLAEMSREQQTGLAQAIKTVGTAYDYLFGFPLPYMMVMHQKPTDGREHPDAHFHVEFYPLNRTADKLKYLAGCESGAGTFITDMAPETQAQRLREALARSGLS